ncbi:MAG TPA: preprotein translocase subunit SecE [Mollicutes bacterium]|jgi:preprotein translocase subunit SecE|nr:preprotein translocase subunit SecE [Mollicutes bacterium]
MEKIKSFFHGVKKEIKRVRWPNKKEMFKNTIAVLLFSFFLGVFFYLINVIIILLKEVFS